MSNYPEIVYWLTFIGESGLKLNRTKPIIQRWCLAEKRALADLFDMSPLELSTTFGLSDEEAQRIIAATERLDQQAALLSQWQPQGFTPLIRIDPHYPRRLAHTLPPVKQPLLLWVQGDLNLLNEPAVTMLGSQEPDEATTTLITELSQALVNENINLVSGYGRGLDRATFEAMMATSGGQAVVVLPLGLQAFAKTTSKLEQVVDDGRVILVSPFAPDTPFDEKLADARNLLIDHLAMALLIPQISEDAQARASAALSRGLPVFVSLTDTAGNRALIDQGALLLTDAGEVVEMVQQAMIDDVLLESTEAELPTNAELSTSPPTAISTPALLADPQEDYGLQGEDIGLIDRDEALEILSLGGEIPDILRQRLQKRVDEEE